MPIIQPYRRRVEEWIKALESDNYQQARSTLKRADGYCCLGVACDLSELGTWTPGTYRIDGNNYSMMLPPQVADYYGLRTQCGQYASSNESLSTDNDLKQMSFKDIAAVIRKGMNDPDGGMFIDKVYQIKPSDLLAVALDDMRRLRDSGQVDIKMSMWWAPPFPGESKCFACMAGCWMLGQGLEYNPQTGLPLGEEDISRMYAINDFRLGNVGGGLGYLGYALPFWQEEAPIYSVNKERFETFIKELILKLKEKGL